MKYKGLLYSRRSRRNYSRLFTRNSKSIVKILQNIFQDNFSLKYVLCTSVCDTYKMTQYNSLKVKLSNSQLSKLKSAIKNENDIVLRLSSNMVGNSNDDTNFLHELLLTNRQVANTRKAFAKNLSIDIKLSKTQLSKIIQSGGFLGRLLGPLLKTGLPLIKSVIKPLAKSVLIPLGLTAAASAADAGIHKKILGSGHNNNTTLII